MNNIGALWSKEQEDWLLNTIQKHDVKYCSQKLERTEGAVISRLKKIALELYKSGNSIKKVQIMTKLRLDDIMYIIHTDSLANYGEPWDEKQDEWLRKYVKKLGITECAVKMERTTKEVENRLYILALEDINKNISPELVCSSLALDTEPYKTKFNQLKTGIALEDVDKLENPPPYYVVLKGRNTGIYSSWEACKISTMGVSSKFKKCSTVEEMKEYISQSKSIGQPSQQVQEVQSPHPSRQRLPSLSEEQEKVIVDMFAGKNVLLLGSAGTGKTTIIQHINRRCSMENIKIGITGSTGTSAILIEGKTLHSFLGIGIAKETPNVLANKLFYKFKSKVQLLQELKILLIDEISMIHAELLTKISKFLSIVRKNTKPFGGIQIIFCGDFYQLPPVEGDFVFKSEIWDSLQLTTHILTKIYRQEETIFQELLERARIGQLTDNDMLLLQKCKNTVFPDDIKPTRLFAVNVQVDRINTDAFGVLVGEERSYPTLCSNKESKKYITAIKFPEMITIKVGAQVMVTRNSSTDKQLVNGTRGVVTKLYKDSVIIKTKYGEKKIVNYEMIPENEVNIAYKYMPLKLAWALTIHKGQGTTLDCVELDLGNSIFEKGQAYTALSRVRSLDSLRILDIKKESFQAHPDVVEFYKNKLK